MPSSSVVSTNTSIFGGVFTTEPGQRLLTLTELLAKRGFQGLYDKCATNISGHYYQTGLRRVHMWSDNVIDEDIEHVRAQCPDLDETYEACFVNYISERYRGGQRPTINCPLVNTFVRRFLESVAQQEAIIHGDFFSTKDPIMRRITCMDATRSALYALVTAESLRIELASEVSSMRRAPSAIGRASSRPDEEDDLATEVKPEDSVSQIGSVVRPAAQSPPRRRVESASQMTQTRFREEEPPDDVKSATVIGMRHEREGVVHRGADSEHSPPAERRPPPSRHDFSLDEEEDDHRRHRAHSPRESVASLRTRSHVGSASSSVSIGMKRLKSPRI